MTSHAFICDAVRTPIGRYGGGLAAVRADDLGAVPLRALLARNPGLDPAAIEEVFYGCANQSGEDNRNVARMSLLLAGLPVSVPGVTVNALRFRSRGGGGRCTRGADRGDGTRCRRRGREHDPRAVRHGQGRRRVRP